MNESVFSTYWYRVANLKPALRDSTAISRHVYRGESWHVLRNRLTGCHHRFNAAASTLIGLMNGERTVEQIWTDAGKILPDQVPTQDEVIRLLGRLHHADLMQCDILPSTAELFHKDRTVPNKKWNQRMANPFSLSFPLWNPDRFLTRWRFVAAPLFTRTALIIWLLIVLNTLVAVFVYWEEISSDFSHRLLSPNNLLLLWLIFPLIKILHEFGHAFAVKTWGGEVHEMGVMLLALTPIPYLDATASAGFTDKRQRIVVAAAGMMVELLVAALALLVWLNVESGLVRNIAYNVMLIGGVSTVLFNGNPLLRYDGYYMLADLLEIPNLAHRSKGYLGYLLQRYLLGIKRAPSTVTAIGEKVWFLVYGPLAWCYRIAVLVGLIWLISGRFFFVGILLAVWGVVALLIVPLVRSATGLLHKPDVQSRRLRLAVIAGGILMTLILALGVWPMPYWTTTQGVIRLPEQSVIRAGTDFEVVEVLAQVEHMVEKGTPLIKGADPFLKAEIKIIRASLQEQLAAYNAQPLYERVRRKMLQEEIQRIKADLHQAEEKLNKLLVRSPTRGKFILIDHLKLPGRFVRQGELLGYIVAEHRPTIRAVVNQADIGLIREKVTGVHVRLAELMEKSLDANIERIIPAADLKLPSAALGTAGGGNIPVDPGDPEGLRALESLFQIDISLPQEVKEPHIGSRVYIRFEHGRKPLVMQWYRSLRQLFLGKFYV